MRMLKHVTHRSSSSLSRSCEYSFRSVGNGPSDSSNLVYPPIGEMDASYRSFRGSEDAVSLVSALSFSSLAIGGRFCSRTSSTVSLNDPSTVPVKIYLRRLRSDMEYKTVSLSLQTTCKELIVLLLAKFRLRHRDPNLFFVLMEVTVRSPTDGAPVKRQLVLEDNARPAELQQCRPKGEANFSIGVRRGGLVRVHDSILMPGSHYKSLMVSYNTTAEELVRLVLSCYNNKDDVKYYCLHETCKGTDIDRPMKADEFPIQTQACWPKENKGAWSFVLRPNMRFTNGMKSAALWRRSLDQSSTDTESELGDHDTTRASIMSSSSTVSNVSHSSTSSGVSCNSSSSCSSSGVSSTDCDSLILSPGSTRSPSSLTLTPETANSKIVAKPPKPVPRTLFPPSVAVRLKMSSSSDEDSGIVLEDDFSPLKADRRPDNTPKLPARSYTVSASSVSKTNSKFARIKSLSKSSVDLKTLTSSRSQSESLSSPSQLQSKPLASSSSQSKSTINLNLKSLFTDKPALITSTPKSQTPARSTTHPKTPNGHDNRRGLFTSDSKILGPLKLRLSTSLGKEPSCACKSCFYI